jgi:hypothetical protein
MLPDPGRGGLSAAFVWFVWFVDQSIGADAPSQRRSPKTLRHISAARIQPRFKKYGACGAR